MIERAYSKRCAAAPKTVRLDGLVGPCWGLTIYFRGFASRDPASRAFIRTGCIFMSVPIERRAGFVDEWDEPFSGLPVRALSADEARALRARSPSVSPWRVVLAQIIVGAFCVAATAWVTGRVSSAWSAFYGAAATVLPSALMARGMTRGTRSAVAAAAGFMFWEMVKIGVAVAMLVIASKVVPGLSWPALLVTMVVCIKVNWVALLWRGPGSEKTKA